MADLGRWLVILGVGIALIGGVVWALGRLGFRGLPGDIRYESSNVRIYIPIATMLVLSILLTALLWLWQWFGRK